MTLTLYPPGRLGGLHSRYGRCGGEENLLTEPGIETRFLSSPARSLNAIPTALPRLRLDVLERSKNGLYSWYQTLILQPSQLPY
jgi:hypothetical protein